MKYESSHNLLRSHPKRSNSFSKEEIQNSEHLVSIRLNWFKPGDYETTPLVEESWLTCWEKFWLVTVASILNAGAELMSSLASGRDSWAVSFTVNMSNWDPSRLSKKSLFPTLWTTMSQEYTDRGAHMRVASIESVAKTVAISSLARRRIIGSSVVVTCKKEASGKETITLSEKNLITSQASSPHSDSQTQKELEWRQHWMTSKQETRWSRIKTQRWRSPQCRQSKLDGKVTNHSNMQGHDLQPHQVILKHHKNLKVAQWVHFLSWTDVTLG